MSSPYFERAVTGVIAVNAGVLVAGLLVDGHEALLEALHDGIVGIFLCELVVRLRVSGWRFLARPFNALDATVILVSALPLAGVDASLLRVARLARLVHFVKHIAQLRLLRFFRVTDCGTSAGKRRIP
jgi:hypothetical protein